MNSKEQRIAIAKACGWKPSNPNDEFNSVWMKGERKQFLPEYLEDLNAMHDAEETLTEEQYSKYGWILLGDGEIECYEFLGAPAAQRAEAFLKSLNLWT